VVEVENHFEYFGTTNRRGKDRMNAECRRFHRFMGGTVLILLWVEWTLARLVHLDGVGRQLRLASFGMMFLLVIALYCRRRTYRQLHEAAVLSIWMVALSILLNLLMQICGRSPALLVDHQLAHIDTLLFAPVLCWIHPVHILRVIYDAVAWLMLLAIMLPTLQGRYRQSQQYIVAVTLAAFITAALFMLWPAVGPWVTNGHQPSPEQTAAQAYLLLLKSPGPVTMDMDIAAIVSFPSFHVVLTLLSAAALWPCRRLRIVLVALCAAICISTVTTGWHYVIDAVGGLAVSLAAQPLANTLLNHVLTTHGVLNPALGEVCGSQLTVPIPRSAKTQPM
jgi:PAP2 superfamily